MIFSLVALTVFLLWVAFQIWLPYLMTVLDRKGELTGAGTFGDSYGALNALFSGLAFAGIVVSIFLQSRELAETRQELEGQKKVLENANVHQVLVYILGEYRSLEMLAAVRGLWQFFRENQADLRNSYTSRLNTESAYVSSLPLGQQLEAERMTLHFKRRLVSQFYQHLAGLYALGIIKGEILYTYWGESDLEIIPRVLIPIETAIMQQLGVSTDKSSATLAKLQKLYDDSRRTTNAA